MSGKHYRDKLSSVSQERFYQVQRGSCDAVATEFVDESLMGNTIKGFRKV